MLLELPHEILEILNFLPVVKTKPGVSLADPDRIDLVLRVAESSSTHFWFLGTNAHPYDLWKAHNTAFFQLFKDGQVTTPQPPAPDEVPYPTDPLRRLIEMHASTTEVLTGLTYLSPWPREDARFR